MEQEAVMAKKAATLRVGRDGAPVQEKRGLLRAGTAKIDITPDEPVYLGGYDLRKTPARRRHGRLYARAVAFDDGVRRFVIMMADLIGIDGAGIRQRIAEATGITPECVFAGDVHNHAAPISRPRSKGTGVSGPTNERTRWFRCFHKAVTQVVADALADLQPVKIGAGVGSSRIAMNRRKRMQDAESMLTFDENNSSQHFGEHRTKKPVMLREFEGVVRLGANPLGPIDDEVGVLRIDKRSGEPLAVLANYACHGTSLGGRNATVCGDWIGRAMSVLEEQLGAQPMYLQGASGDINPRFVGGLDGHMDSIQRTDELGEEFAREVVRVYGQTATRTCEGAIIRAAHRLILLPRCYREVLSDFRNTTVVAPVSAVRIGDVTWVSFPGEMFHEIGLRVKHASPTAMTFLCGYTNGSIGYFPTQAAFAEGGYEPAASHLDPMAEKHYLRQMAEVMTELR
jgi:neutral ceramidase